MPADANLAATLQGLCQATQQLLQQQRALGLRRVPAPPTLLASAPQAWAAPRP